MSDIEFVLDGKKLESVINNEMTSLRHSPFENSSFAIYDDGKMQVQVKITKDQYEFHDDLLPEYIK